MRKVPSLASLLIIGLLLTACGSANTSTSGNGFGGGGTSTTGFRTNRTSTPLSPEAKLALGTIKLEGTNEAVDPEMAAKLIPLWQLMVQVKSSSTSAPQEAAAVLDQIRATMKPAQLNNIDKMSLSSADMFTAFQTQGNGSGTGAEAGGGSGFSQGTGRGNRGNGGGFVFGGGPGGGFGGGGFGGGGFGGGGARAGGAGSNAGSQTSSTLTQAQAAQARENAISSLVANQLIRLLQTKLSG
ncbi:MAG TPA: hypothetical protein VMJ64_04070 [Anaerolineales bacterium]|nr:hypothetical protein [Anaerolineales bacterium]